MKDYRVVWQSDARSDLIAIYRWIADAADPGTAIGFIEAIRGHTGKLASFPSRGRPREDIGPGIRTVPFRRRTLIAYRVHSDWVEILRVAYAGRHLGLD
ncbi:type II toxin-antitoxin system RelE/ParE family toxin [Altererythrobacter soli]|uniref:Type II toxin-antitoxin system RelE/ParE family toxin n=1 Tax=Croceibacterium soli TaxID=1739690 RepID=A0A6I4UVQ9_9SPHN|nr:type II toxin-antitoxin system RelE/ParE family toxin [Croceibacterium soli]MXP41934.1 type II toxin-antitoxin system RelE/ParE family toxin [Croceibacterium soli]